VDEWLHVWDRTRETSWGSGCNHATIHSNTRSITEELPNLAGDNKEARAAFRAALSVWPGHRTALWNEAQVAEEQHDIGSAARAYEAIVNATRRSDSRALSALGWVLFRGGLAGRGETVLMEAAR